MGKDKALYNCTHTLSPHQDWGHKRRSAVSQKLQYQIIQNYPNIHTHLTTIPNTTYMHMHTHTHAHMHTHTHAHTHLPQQERAPPPPRPLPSCLALPSLDETGSVTSFA
jgi:hypothetical protein